MESLSALKIGYVPYSLSLKAAGDRRRFCHYARVRGIQFEVAKFNKRYDLVVVCGASDFSIWSRRCPSLGQIILDLPDPYLSAPFGLGRLLKGPGKFVMRRWERFEWSFMGALRRICERADGIACSTPEQKKKVAALNANTHDVVDFHQGDFHVGKQGYRPSKPFRLVWEGVGDSLLGIKRIGGALRRLHSEFPLELHILTDLRFRPMNRLLTVDTRRWVSQHISEVPTYLYEWNQSLFSAIATNCDLAMVPVDTCNKMVVDKAENRLLLFWQMGVPCVTSTTPSFARVYQACGLDAHYNSLDQWYCGLKQLLLSEEARQNNVFRGQAYLKAQVSEEALLAKWDGLFASVLAKR